MITDKEAKEIGLKEFLKRNIGNPECEVMYYVGKRTTDKYGHDAEKDHMRRDERGRQGTIVNACRTGEKVAFEVARHDCDSKESMEAEEAWYQVLVICTST